MTLKIVRIIIVTKRLFYKVLYRIFKKLVLILATSIIVIETSKENDIILDLYYALII